MDRLKAVKKKIMLAFVSNIYYQRKVRVKKIITNDFANLPRHVCDVLRGETLQQTRVTDEAV